MGIGKQAKLGAGILLALAIVVAAATYAPIAVQAYNSVLNPNNLLTDGSDYTTLQYATNITCPQGNFYKHPTYPNNFCVHNGTGTVIAGWEVVQFDNSTGKNTTNVTVIGTGLSASYTTSVMVFRAGTTYNSATQWTYIGACNFAVGTNHSTCTIAINQTLVGNILLGRFSAGSFRGNPGVNYVQLQG